MKIAKKKINGKTVPIKESIWPAILYSAFGAIFQNNRPYNNQKIDLLL